MEPITAKGVTGSVTFDGTFVTIDRSGLGRLTVGKGEKRIPVGQITATQWKPPSRLVRGYLAFTVPGGNESRSQLGRATVDAASDENAVVVGFRQADEFQALRAAIDRKIAERYA